MRHPERSIRSPALGVDYPLGDAFPILMGQLFDQLVVLQQDRAALPGGQGVLVISHRRASACRHDRTAFLRHVFLLSSACFFLSSL